MNVLAGVDLRFDGAYSCGTRFLRGLLLDIRWDSLSHGAHSYTATRLENYRARGPQGYK